MSGILNCLCYEAPKKDSVQASQRFTSNCSNPFFAGIPNYRFFRFICGASSSGWKLRCDATHHIWGWAVE